MISSPCRNCERKYQSKDECLETCQKLAAIRNMQFSRREVNICHAIDYADDNRFLIGYSDYKRVAA
jgi:hypothetical protein